MKRLSKPPVRHTSKTNYVTSEDAGRIVSDDEKYELIRAHAAARQKRPHGYKLGYYIAVAASCLVVVTSYALTRDRVMIEPVQKPDPTYEVLVQNMDKFKTEIDQSADKIKKARKQFEAASATTTNIK